MLLFLSLIVADACYLFTLAQLWGRTVGNVMWNVLFVPAECWCPVLEMKCCREERLNCQTFPVGTGYPMSERKTEEDVEGEICCWREGRREKVAIGRR